MLGWILTIRCMLYYQFLGEKIPIFYLGSKISLKKSVTGKLQGLLLFYFLFLPSFQLIVSID